MITINEVLNGRSKNESSILLEEIRRFEEELKILRAKIKELEAAKEEIDTSVIERVTAGLATKFSFLQKGDKGDQGDSPSVEELVTLIKPLIPEFIPDPLPGQNGYTPVKGVDYFDGEPGEPGKPGKPGKDGYTPQKGVDYFDGKDGKDGAEISADAVIEKIKESEKKIPQSKIDGLEERFRQIVKTIRERTGIVRGGGDVMNFYDLSSQTNGVLKIFTVPKNRKAIVLCSDFPSVLMEGNGFTLDSTRTQLTLTTTNAPSSGAQLMFQYA